MSATKELLFSAGQQHGDNEPAAEDDMLSVDQATYLAAHRFGVIAGAGARMRQPPRVELDHNARQSYGPHAIVKEWAAPGGLVLARSVVTHDSSEYWLRRDLADKAIAALTAEAADSARIAQVVVEEMNRRDSALAAARGETVEQLRTRRNHAGMRWDRARAANRAGGL